MNYKKENEALIAQWKAEIQKHNQVITQLRQKAEKVVDQYNPRVATVNSERASLFQEIRKLYHFLKGFGNVGKEITPCDFCVEDFMWPSIAPFTCQSDLQAKQATPNGSTAGNVAMVATAVFVPLATPLMFVGKALFDSKKQKQYYLDNTENHEKDMLARRKQRDDAEAEIKFFEAARDISELYLRTIMGIKAIINDTIMPELDGISAFLYADAIKDCIIDGKNPRNAEPHNIAEYSGTAYDVHYTFVRNAFDYYTLITKFFTSGILANIFDDHQVTDEEKHLLKNKIAEIENSQKLLEAKTVFGGQ